MVLAPAMIVTCLAAWVSSQVAQASQPLTFTQITNSTRGSNDGASINATGTRIAFQSDRDLTPGNRGNAGGNREIFSATSAPAGGEDQLFLTRLFEQALNREPDPAGLREPIDQIAQFGSVVPTVLAFFHSQEFLNRNPEHHRARDSALSGFPRPASRCRGARGLGGCPQSRHRNARPARSALRRLVRVPGDPAPVVSVGQGLPCTKRAQQAAPLQIQNPQSTRLLHGFRPLATIGGFQVSSARVQEWIDGRPAAPHPKSLPILVRETSLGPSLGGLSLHLEWEEERRCPPPLRKKGLNMPPTMANDGNQEEYVGSPALQHSEKLYP